MSSFCHAPTTVESAFDHAAIDTERPSMPITHATVHRLIRRPEQPGQIIRRDGELADGEVRDQLLGKLKASFLGRISREHGSFDDENGPSILAAALSTLQDDEDQFNDLSQQLLQPLVACANENALELNLLAFFFVEKSLDHHRFYLLLAPEVETLALDGSLSLQKHATVDTGASIFGIKVDIREWQAQQRAYLSLIVPRGNPALADAFRQLTGFANGLDKQAATHAFLEGVESYASQLPEERVDEYRNQIVNYCMEQDERDQAIDCRDLARNLDDIDDEEFVRAIASRYPDSDNGVMMDRRSLKRYVKFAGRERDLAISFSSSQLNSRVQYDAAADRLSILGIPKALREQLKAHLKSD